LLALLCVGLALGLGGLAALLGCGHCDGCKVVRTMTSWNVHLGLVRKGDSVESWDVNSGNHDGWLGGVVETRTLVVDFGGDGRVLRCC
jgi:hypothetical protein